MASWSYTCQQLYPLPGELACAALWHLHPQKYICNYTKLAVKILTLYVVMMYILATMLFSYGESPNSLFWRIVHWQYCLFWFFFQKHFVSTINSHAVRKAQSDLTQSYITIGMYYIDGVWHFKCHQKIFCISHFCTLRFCFKQCYPGVLLQKNKLKDITV